MSTLLSVVGDSDVRADDTEVRKSTPLTSPFIEGIYGAVVDESIKLPAHIIGIGGRLAAPLLPHHRAYGSRTRRFGQ